MSFRLGRPGSPTRPIGPVTGVRVRLVPASVALLCGLAIGCSGEEAVPIDPANPPTTIDLTDVTHRLEPTEQMQDLAEQQCLDDPDLDEGFVQAVDPDTDQIMSQVTVDCAEVRGQG